jgi:proline iminopeptidase
MTTAALSEETGYADVPGGKVWWMRVGSGPNTPLLLLHGGPGAAHNYLLPLKLLADERPVIFYDQLGCGRSDIPTDPGVYRIGRFVEEIDALRNALGLNRMNIASHVAASASNVLCSVARMRARRSASPA